MTIVLLANFSVHCVHPLAKDQRWLLVVFYGLGGAPVRNPA